MQINPFSGQPVNLPPAPGQEPAAVPSTSQADLDQEKQEILTDIDALLNNWPKIQIQELKDFSTELTKYKEMLISASQETHSDSLKQNLIMQSHMIESYGQYFADPEAGIPGANLPGFNLGAVKAALTGLKERLTTFK
jgi:hypothetical protein